MDHGYGNGKVEEGIWMREREAVGDDGGRASTMTRGDLDEVFRSVEIFSLR